MYRSYCPQRTRRRKFDPCSSPQCGQIPRQGELAGEGDDSHLFLCEVDVDSLGEVHQITVIGGVDIEPEITELGDIAVELPPARLLRSILITADMLDKPLTVERPGGILECEHKVDEPLVGGLVASGRRTGLRAVTRWSHG